MPGSNCLACHMPHEGENLSYCPNFICEHNYVKAICIQCCTPEQWAEYQSRCTTDEPGR